MLPSYPSGNVSSSDSPSSDMHSRLTSTVAAFSGMTL